MTSFETKKKIVLAGNSRIFNDWAAHSTITMDEFISALQWLCEDALDENGKLTREIALAPAQNQPVRERPRLKGVYHV